MTCGYYFDEWGDVNMAGTPLFVCLEQSSPHTLQLIQNADAQMLFP